MGFMQPIIIIAITPGLLQLEVFNNVQIKLLLRCILWSLPPEV